MNCRFKYTKVRSAMTTEDRLWRVVAGSCAKLHELATNPNLSNQAKKVRAEGHYQTIRGAFKALGVIR